MLNIEEALSDAASLALEFIRSEEEKPVAPYRTPEQLLGDLDLSLQEKGLDHDEFIQLIREVLAFTPKTCSGCFYNQLFGGRDAVATLAEILAVVINTSMYTFKAAGPHVLIEQEVVSRMCRKVGFEHGDGILCPGGSIANLLVMAVARNEAEPGLRETGHSGRPMTVYASSESHYSITKSAGVIGIGRANVRQIRTDPSGRMDVDALNRAIAEDISAGRLPVAIVATAGTTVLGAFDPVADIAEVAGEHGVWLHVDGAFGGSVLMSGEHRHLLAGSEKADSFIWNPHKMMGVPVVCSAALFRNRAHLSANLYEQAEYLFQTEDDELNPGTRSLQCGRRNDAFKLWAAWRYHGDEGYERKVQKQFALARYAADRIEADGGLALTLYPESINVCFEVAGKSSEQICQALRERELAVIGYGVVGGRRVIRLVCLNDALSTADIDDFLATVKAIAADLPPGENDI